MSLALGRHLDQTLANQMGPLAYAATPVSGAMAPRFKRGFEVVQNVEGNKARISGLDFFDGLPSLPLSLSRNQPWIGVSGQADWCDVWAQESGKEIDPF